MTDERLVEVTGKDHEEWFAVLDAAGADAMSHRDIAASLVADHGVPGWWAQHVTVSYEKARGRRVLHQRGDTFEVSKSKTVHAPVDQVYRAFVDAGARARWLDGELEITSTQPERAVNGRWGGGPERLTVRLTPKGDAKTHVGLGHLKLPSAEAAEAAKAAWAERLARLADLFR